MILPIPRLKPGYKFEGWYQHIIDSENDIDLMIPTTKIEIGARENVDVHVQYTKIPGTTNKPSISNKPGTTSSRHEESSSGGEPASSLQKRSKTSGKAGLTVTNPSLTGDTGKWVPDGSNWKYQLPDNTYANRQWIYVDDKWYLIGADDTMLRGWQLVNGKWYLLNCDGAMLTGCQQVDHKWYYMNVNGEMLSDRLTPDGYRVDKDGAWIQ